MLPLRTSSSSSPVSKGDIDELRRLAELGNAAAADELRGLESE